jgi:hypothetical protein
LVLLVPRKSEENWSLDEVAPLVALRLATFVMADVISVMLIDDMDTAADVVAALPKFIVELTLRASLIFNELIEMDEPESPRVDM